MGRSSADFDIVREDHAQQLLVIRDRNLGRTSVTNDAEWVVHDLFEMGLMRTGWQLWYFDSEGQLDELVVVAGRFQGFAPLSGPERAYAHQVGLIK